MHRDGELNTRSHSTRELMEISPVIPVVTIDDPKIAVPVAQALAEGGVKVIEVTLRTPTGLEALKRIAQELPSVTAGAGTVLTPQQADEAVAAGAEFLVSPGLSSALSAWISESDVPFLPGVSNLGQIMEARDSGLTELKFFPAEPAGGVSYLKAIAAPIPDVIFCPTGGIGTHNAADYLALPNVACVGGSWLVPTDLTNGGDFAEITRRSIEVRSLRIS